MNLAAEPDDPAKFNKESIDKLRKDLNSKPIIARKLSQNQGAKEFLEQSSQTDTPSPEAPAESSSEISTDLTPHQPPSEVPINTVPQEPPFKIPDNIHPEISHEFPMDTPQETQETQETQEDIPSDNLPAETVPDEETPSEADSAQEIPSKEELEDARRKAEMDTKKKKHNKSQISYKKKTVVFYRKECQLENSCIKVPVITNLKSVIFEYNQGRYSAHSAKFSSQSK